MSETTINLPRINFMAIIFVIFIFSLFLKFIQNFKLIHEKLRGADYTNLLFTLVNNQKTARNLNNFAQNLNNFAQD